MAGPSRAVPRTLLGVETRKEPFSDPGYLNAIGTADQPKRKMTTDRSTAWADKEFTPVKYDFSQYILPYSVPVRYFGHGIKCRDEELAPEFAPTYNSNVKKLESVMEDEGVDMIRRTIADLAGLDIPTSPQHNTESDSEEEFALSPDVWCLSVQQREELFSTIFAAGGRVPVTGKPEWNLIIHKAYVSKLIHLCLEKPCRNGMNAFRICTQPGCYSYSTPHSNLVLPKCSLHGGSRILTVLRIVDYNNVEKLVQFHMQIRHSMTDDDTPEETDDKAQIQMGHGLSDVQDWKAYRDGKDGEAVARSIARKHFISETDALKQLSLWSTVGLFQKIAPGHHNLINLDNLIPFAYGIEREVKDELKQIGLRLKIRRKLSKEEKQSAEFLFPFGEFLLNDQEKYKVTKTKGEQKEDPTHAFLYVVSTYNAWYFGWMRSPDLAKRTARRTGDGLIKYRKLNPAVNVYPVDRPL